MISSLTDEVRTLERFQRIAPTSPPRRCRTPGPHRHRVRDRRRLRAYCAATVVTTYTASASFVVPARVWYIEFDAVGGGSGPSGNGAATNGRSGAGGAFAGHSAIPVVPGETLTIEVDAPTAASGTNNSSIGGDGGAVRLKRGATILVEAKGATGGRGSAVGGQAGVAGTAAASTVPAGGTKFSGGNGALASGGGGGAGKTGAGTAASTGVSAGGAAGSGWGGTAGNAGTTTQTTPNTPSGGGGAGNTSNTFVNALAGSRGEARMTYTPIPYARPIVFN